MRKLKLGAALGAAIAVIGAGIGIGKIGGSAMEANLYHRRICPSYD